MPRPETLCAHSRAGEGPNAPLVEPVWQNSVWTVDSAESCEAVIEGASPGFIYSREKNPNAAQLERLIAALEESEEAVVLSSGMAAVAASLASCCGAGDTVVVIEPAYGLTLQWLRDEMSRFDLQVKPVAFGEAGLLDEALRSRPAALLVETITNPLMQVPDLPNLGRLCAEWNVPLIVDNTFATPILCRPLKWGAALTLHSITKFIGGHSDVTLGAVAGSSEHCARVRRFVRLWGGAPSPGESWLALRGAATLPLRMERSCANATELARRLQTLPQVGRVFHPSISADGAAALESGMLSSGGPMLGFELAGAGRARALLRALRKIAFAPSLGDVATTISYPAGTSHRTLSSVRLAELGISPGLLRLSVGIDHVEDVWADLSRAIAEAALSDG